MTVLFPIGSLYPAQSGGPSNTVYWIGKALKRKGVSVKIVTTDRDIENGKVELDKWLSLDYGEVRYCKTKMHYLPMSLLANGWKAVRSVDVVHLTALYYPPSLLMSIRAVIARKPIVWSVRGELHESALRFSRLKKKIYLYLISLVPQKRITFHTTSPEETELVRNQFGEKARVIQLPNFIELPEVFETKSESLYFLFIGRIHPIKALENIIEGLATSKLFRDSAYSFQLAGEGDPNYINGLKENILKLGLSDRIFFIGPQSGLDKQKLYANARYTFLLSHSENFGNVVVESLAQSTPVVASTGTPWQRLERENAGYWISNSPASIAAVVDKIIGASQADYQQSKMAARKLAEAEFNIYNNTDKWIEAYASSIT